MKTYEYILLDWDGNLAKTLDLWLNAFKQVLNEEGHDPSDKEIAASFGKVTEYFASLGITDAADVYERADKLGKGRLPEVELYPDALEVLEYLKKSGKKTALITSSRAVNVLPLLDRYDLHLLFDAIVTRDEVTEHKPHPESLNLALKLLGGTREEAVMIGDSDKDLGAARNAGVDSILFYPPEHEKFYELIELKTLSPTYVISDFRDIRKIVR